MASNKQRIAHRSRLFVGRFARPVHAIVKDLDEPGYLSSIDDTARWLRRVSLLAIRDLRTQFMTAPARVGDETTRQVSNGASSLPLQQVSAAIVPRIRRPRANTATGPERTTSTSGPKDSNTMPRCEPWCHVDSRDVPLLAPYDDDRVTAHRRQKRAKYQEIPRNRLTWGTRMSTNN